MSSSRQPERKRFFPTKLPEFLPRGRCRSNGQPLAHSMRLVSLLALCLAATTAWSVDFTSAIPANCRQVILVTAQDWSASRGTLQRYERADAHAHWQAAGAATEVLL